MGQAFPVEQGAGQDTMGGVEQETRPRTPLEQERSLLVPVDFADAEMTGEEPTGGPKAESRRKRKNKRRIKREKVMEMLSADGFDGGLISLGKARMRWKLEREAVRVLTKKAYGCDQDPESRVTVFCPTQGELGNFAAIMFRVIKASGFRIGGVPHVGVSDIRLPTKFAVRLTSPTLFFRMVTTQEADPTAMEDDTKCITYRVQSGKTVPNSEDCIFRIHDEDTDEPVTVAEWGAEASKGFQTQQGYWKGGCFRCLLRSDEFKAVYVIGQNGTETSRLLNTNSISLRQLLVSGPHLTNEIVPSDWITVCGPGWVSPMQYQRPDELSLSYLASGSRRRWVIVGPNSKEELENKLRRIYPNVPDNMPFHTFIQQERIYILPEFLRRHGIAFEDISQGVDSMLVLFPGTYYASYSRGESFTVSTTYYMKNASQRRTAIPTGRSRHEVRKSLKRPASVDLPPDNASGTQLTPSKRLRSEAAPGTRVIPANRLKAKIRDPRVGSPIPPPGLERVLAFRPKPAAGTAMPQSMGGQDPEEEAPN
ncbi:MAG: hypothetical protein M1840_000433 [Geoglossum simile]|nr:MAG: hypothetical protein M1840_000433 [Geoglossum simile]